MKSVYNTILRAIMKTFIILRLYFKIRVINGLGKYTKFFDDAWYWLIHMESKVELALELIRFFKDAFLFFHLKKFFEHKMFKNIASELVNGRRLIFCLRYNRGSP